MTQFQPPMDMANRMYDAFFPQPTIYTFPPQYGSFMHPLQPLQWREAIAAAYNQPIPPGPMPMAYRLGFPDIVNGNDMEISHQCNCGDGCQCIGCTAHPYNEATQRTVLAAWNTQLEQSPTEASGKEIPGQGVGCGTSSGANDTRTPVLPQVGEPSSPSHAQTPSDSASVLNDEQVLSASDFLFVTYPFGGDSCAGETASCSCGDDCQCLDCTIHSINQAPGPD
jgi:hypothetical protein